MTSRKKTPLFPIILTGLSGAGKTVALNALEDSGFFCVDNLPTTLIEKFVSLSNKTPTLSRIAIGVDIRERKFLSGFSETIASLRKKYRVEIIFLEANEEVLVRRFKETRRPHPIAYKNLRQAIRREISLLSVIRKEADRIIETSTLNPHQLRKLITEMHVKKEIRDLTISLVSFGFKYGIPSEADLLFDVRFLPNPHFIENLKDFPGTSPRVKKFVLSQKDAQEFIKRLQELLGYLIPLYRQEGRTYLTVGIGCTGGRHRSPAISEEMRKLLKKQKQNVSLLHRDMSDH